MLNSVKKCNFNIEVNNVYLDSGGSMMKGWELMVLALSAFPPQKDFENFLEIFLRQNAPSGSKER